MTAPKWNLIDEKLIALRARLEEKCHQIRQQLEFSNCFVEEAAIRIAVTRLENVIDASDGPGFDDDGFISPIQKLTEDEIIWMLGATERRKLLLERVRKWIALARAVGARRLLLDGSFVTRKEEPGDVDAVIMLLENFKELEESQNPAAIELREIIQSRNPAELFSADNELQWWCWFEFFSRTRELTGRHKGLIEVRLR